MMDIELISKFVSIKSIILRFPYQLFYHYRRYNSYRLNSMKQVSVIFFVLMSLSLCAQVDNDACTAALFIPDISNYCSGPNEFTNEGATLGIGGNPSCWPQDTESNDVWFVFNPAATAVFIQVTGATNEGVGTIQQPAVAVYTGTCRGGLDEEACSTIQPGDPNILELTITNLIIGRSYFLRVDGRDNNVGSFRLCLRQFNPPPSPEADCSAAVVLCDQSSFLIENLNSTGQFDNEVDGTCVTAESASSWYKWTADQSGTLEFTLTPNNISDDLDFAVFRLPGGLDDCDNKELVRCMASGETQGASDGQNANCMGATGIRVGENDVEETAGCALGDNNFVAALDMVQGETYALVVNNFSESGSGFAIDFAGTGTFLGPEPDFTINAIEQLECDRLVFFTEQSKSNGDPIVNFFWNFGEGAEPATAEGNNVQEVVYESFGSKVVALTVETSRGCLVTQLLTIEVASCCQLDSDLDFSADGTDLTCFQSEDGEISLTGINGSPDYLYSFNGGDFQPSPQLTGLQAGNFSVGIQDIKGCEVFDLITLDQPVELIVEVASQDESVDLGFSTFFTSDFDPSDRIVTYEWTPPDGLECTDCPDPEVFGVGDITYTLTITDQDGCMASDQVTLLTVLNRNFHAPNVLSRTSVNGNDEFKIITNPATDIIEEISIYDRYGGRLYNRTNIVFDLNDEQGWFGLGPNGQFVNPGVYVWAARIRFVDNEVITYTGTITVLN